MLEDNVAVGDDLTRNNKAICRRRVWPDIVGRAHSTATPVAPTASLSPGGTAGTFADTGNGDGSYLDMFLRFTSVAQHETSARLEFGSRIWISLPE